MFNHLRVSNSQKKLCFFVHTGEKISTHWLLPCVLRYMAGMLVSRSLHNFDNMDSLSCPKQLVEISSSISWQRTRDKCNGPLNFHTDTQAERSSEEDTLPKSSHLLIEEIVDVPLIHDHYRRQSNEKTTIGPLSLVTKNTNRHSSVLLISNGIPVKRIFFPGVSPTNAPYPLVINGDNLTNGLMNHLHLIPTMSVGNRCNKRLFPMVEPSIFNR